MSYPVFQVSLSLFLSISFLAHIHSVYASNRKGALLFSVCFGGCFPTHVLVSPQLFLFHPEICCTFLPQDARCWQFPGSQPPSFRTIEMLWGIASNNILTNARFILAWLKRQNGRARALLVKSLAAIGNPLLNSPTASSDIDKHQLR